MMLAAFSAIIMTGAHVFPLMRCGITLASTTLRPSTPLTRKSGSTTLDTSSAEPILQVATG